MASKILWSVQINPTKTTLKRLQNPCNLGINFCDKINNIHFSGLATFYDGANRIGRGIGFLMSLSFLASCLQKYWLATETFLFIYTAKQERVLETEDHGTSSIYLLVKYQSLHPQNNFIMLL